MHATARVGKKKFKKNDYGGEGQGAARAGRRRANNAAESFDRHKGDGRNANFSFRPGGPPGAKRKCSVVRSIADNCLKLIGIDKRGDKIPKLCPCARSMKTNRTRNGPDIKDHSRRRFITNNINGIFTPFSGYVLRPTRGRGYSTEVGYLTATKKKAVR